MDVYCQVARSEPGPFCMTSSARSHSRWCRISVSRDFVAWCHIDKEYIFEMFHVCYISWLNKSSIVGRIRQSMYYVWDCTGTWIHDINNKIYYLSSRMIRYRSLAAYCDILWYQHHIRWSSCRLARLAVFHFMPFHLSVSWHWNLWCLQVLFTTNGELLYAYSITLLRLASVWTM